MTPAERVIATLNPNNTFEDNAAPQLPIPEPARPADVLSRSLRECSPTNRTYGPNSNVTGSRSGFARSMIYVVFQPLAGVKARHGAPGNGSKRPIEFTPTAHESAAGPRGRGPRRGQRERVFLSDFLNAICSRPESRQDLRLLPYNRRFSSFPCGSSIFFNGPAQYLILARNLILARTTDQPLVLTQSPSRALGPSPGRFPRQVNPQLQRKRGGPCVSNPATCGSPVRFS